MKTLDIGRLTLHLDGVSPAAAQALARTVAGRLSHVRLANSAQLESLRVGVRARRGETPDLLSARIAAEVESTLNGGRRGR
jgi:hypothetical protein